MIAASIRPLDPYSDGLPEQRGTGTGPVDTGTSDIPASQRGAEQPTPVPAQLAPTDRTGSIPMPTDPVQGITTLPDGAGGSITVPPVSLAPSSVVPPTTTSYQTTGGFPTPPGTTIDPATGIGHQGPTEATPMLDALTPPAASPAPWDAPAAPGTFNATTNLLTSQVTPGADPRLLSMQTAQDAALAKITNGPDRLTLANQYYDAATPAMDAQFQHDLHDATAAAGAHGSLGSGTLTNRYGDLFSGLEQSKQAAKLRYLTDAATGSIGDNLNAYGATASGEGQAYSQGVGDRNELRTERGYQQSVAQTALQQRIAEQQAEQAAQQQSYENAIRLYSLGNQNNPQSAYETAAGQSSLEAAAAAGDVGSILKLYAMRNAPTATKGGR